jgi:hypothetical protein
VGLYARPMRGTRRGFGFGVLACVTLVACGPENPRELADATGLDAAPAPPDAYVPPSVDAPFPDAWVEPLRDAPGAVSDAPLGEDAPSGMLADCSAFAASAEVCSATPTGCHIVFRSGGDCAAACARGGMTCLESYRDDDGVSPPRCAIYEPRESYACAPTGHMSDYCVCGMGTVPDPTMLAFEGAEGFGARAQGGRGGTVYTVTNLNDSGTGSLRWAVERSGRRIVQFDVDGIIRLRSPLNIADPYITIDGRGALDPGERGITVRDHSLNITTHDVVVRYLRWRLGDVDVLTRTRGCRDTSGRARLCGSDDLDCVNIDRASNVILDHMSLSWSADEIVSVTRSRNVTVQWSILSEPLSNWRIHPYGDNHAFCANDSASTLTFHHNLFAHFVFRGPQFEANDMQDVSPRFDANFEAVNNVVYGYTSSGSRYRLGFERAADRVTSVDFNYHFVGNRYINSDTGTSEINVDLNHVGAVPGNVHVYVQDNIGPHRRAGGGQLDLVFTDNNASASIRGSSAAMGQVSSTPLFTSTVPVTTTSADVARDAVFAGAGCSIERDTIDTRVIGDARAGRAANVVQSQSDVPGGW